MVGLKSNGKQTFIDNQGVEHNHDIAISKVANRSSNSAIP